MKKLAQYVNLLNSFQDLVDIPKPHLALLQKMISAGFIVKENVDEFQQVRKREHDFFSLKRRVIKLHQAVSSKIFTERIYENK